MNTRHGKTLKNSSPRIAAVVVLYLPAPEVADNIRSWTGQVDTIYAVDNSEAGTHTAIPAIETLEKLTLIRNKENAGIATALNIGAEKAVAEGYEYLLTMDQDSRAPNDMVAKMLECANGMNMPQIGIISPFHVTGTGHLPDNVVCQDIMTPMTSGCLLNLEAYRKVGPFRDDFFIDFVDNEYCLRLRRAGFAVIRANRALLEHMVGDTKMHGPFVATNHSPLRRYYKTRNRFQVFREYFRDFPGHCIFDLVRLTKEIISIILFETEKNNKFKMMWRGWRDFRLGKFGKYKGEAL